MSEHLYVLEDEHGDLFLADESTCRESTSPVVLEDHRLWDAYVKACNAANRAGQAVRDALKVPWVDVTPETLTMRQVADVKQWAQDNGRKGLYADASRCEDTSRQQLGAMRRVCAHINKTGHNLGTTGSCGRRRIV